MSAQSMMALGVVVLSAALAEASAPFRGNLDGLHAHQQASLWLEDRLVGALGGEFAQRVERRREQRERILSPTVDSLPKNKWGGLGESGTRYALHRYFVHRHGMFVIGLEPSNETLAISPVETILGGRVPSDLEADAEARLHGRGFGLQELSVLSAAMEHFIHAANVNRLRVAFKLLNLPTEGGVVTPEQMDDAINIYFVLFFMTGDLERVTQQEVNQRRRVMETGTTMNGWAAIQHMARQEQDQLLESGDASGLSPFDFATRVVDEADDKLGRVQNQDCHDLKRKLMSMDSGAQGRVPLSTFYNTTLDNSWRFTESIEYMKKAGILEERHPPILGRVIIPNYVNGPSNCVSREGLFTMCCINECTELMGHIESKVRTPEVTPQRLVQILQNLPSSTVPAPRELPTNLVVRLDQIAQAHQGKVPIHGRLFAQLLHHAFPLECPFPHFINSSAPTHKVLQEVFESDKEEITQWLSQASSEAESAGVEPEVYEESMPWSHQEELLVGKHRRTSYLEDLAMLLVVVAGFGGLRSSFGTLQQTMRKAQLFGAKKRYMV